MRLFYLFLLFVFSSLIGCGEIGDGVSSEQETEEQVILEAPLPDLPEPNPSGETPAPKAEPKNRPNVVLIIIDTLRADKVGSYGCKEETTPALDRLAAKGVQFDRTIAQAPWTRPSVGSLLTSMYPRTVGLYREENEILNDRFTLLSEVLQRHGYTTLGLTANPNMNTVYNFHRGFDEYHDSNVLFGWMDITEGKVARGRVSLPPAPEMFETALRYLKENEGKKPFYIQINVMEVHEWVANKPSTNMLLPEYETYFAKEGEEEDKYVKYLRLTRQVTDQIGEFVKAIQSLPGAEDTLFIFVSDHGEGLGDHPKVFRSEYHGRILYESQMMVPWIMYREGWTPARARIRQDVRLLDLMPTLLDYLDIPAPEGIEGKSLMPLINGEVDKLNLGNFYPVETYFKGENKVGIYGLNWMYIHNRTPHRGLPRYEVHARGKGPQNGPATNKYKEQPKVVQAMRRFLSVWERNFEKAEPTPAKTELSQEERDQLEAIGYLD
jgi:arylsulfatase A-like enzyme